MNIDPVDTAENVHEPFRVSSFSVDLHPRIKAPYPACETMGIQDYYCGEFTIGLARSGWWGIAVPDVVGLEHKEKQWSRKRCCESR